MEIDFAQLIPEIQEASCDQKGFTQLKRITLTLQGFLVIANCRNGIFGKEPLENLRNIYQKLNKQKTGNNNGLPDLKEKLIRQINHYQTTITMDVAPVVAAFAEAEEETEATHMALAM